MNFFIWSNLLGYSWRLVLIIFFVFFYIYERFFCYPTRSLHNWIIQKRARYAKFRSVTADDSFFSDDSDRQPTLTLYREKVINNRFRFLKLIRFWLIKKARRIGHTAHGEDYLRIQNRIQHISIDIIMTDGSLIRASLFFFQNLSLFFLHFLQDRI